MVDQLAASFRDPSGFLYRQDGTLYRQVNSSYASDFEKLMGSGLYETLTGRGLLIPHQRVAPTNSDPAVYAVLQPEEIPFVSYPYEWCFGQLKAAALATLEIQLVALDHGMTLKDASAYNIQFVGARPTLIDTLSFTEYHEGEAWVAYRQYCQHFLAPLALMAYHDVRLGQLLRTFIDGVPLDLTSGLLRRRTWLRFGLVTNLHLHARAQGRYSASAEGGAPRRSTKVSKRGLLGLIDSLRRTTEALRWKIGASEWVYYYEKEHRYSDLALEAKERHLDDWIDRLAPSSVWDLGANTGRFSRLASRRGIPTVAFDIDFGAVERSFQKGRAENDGLLLPLFQDLTNPSPGNGWSGEERASLESRGPVDLVLALALIHHLAISNNVPLGQVAKYFAGLSRWLVIEFVPKGDSQVDRLLSSREDIFPHYHVEGFESAFGEYFAVRESVQIADTERRLYLLEAH